jgi:hypothetical protein
MHNRSIAIAVSLLSSLMRYDIVFIKPIISLLFDPPIRGDFLFRILNNVLLENEIPLIRFVRKDKPLQGFLQFLFLVHFFSHLYINRGKSSTSTHPS